MLQYLAVIGAISGILSPAFGLLGVYLGFRWNESGARRREERVEKAQRANIRILLRVEMEQDKDLFQKFWDNINQIPARDYIDEKEKDNAVCYRLMQIPFPRWSNDMWQSQLSVLYVALSAAEIKQAHNFYRALATLEDIHPEIAQLESEIQGTHDNDYFGWRIKKIDELWGEYKKIAGELSQMLLLQ